MKKDNLLLLSSSTVFIWVLILVNYYGGGGGELGKWSLGKKIKNEELGEKMKKGKEKGRIIN